MRVWWSKNLTVARRGAFLRARRGKITGSVVASGVGSIDRLRAAADAVSELDDKCSDIGAICLGTTAVTWLATVGRPDPRWSITRRWLGSA